MSNSSKKPYACIVSKETEWKCLEFLKKELGIAQEHIDTLTITFSVDSPVIVEMKFYPQEVPKSPIVDTRLTEVEYHFFNHPLDVTARV